jgi:hypothetical protein
MRCAALLLVITILPGMLHGQTAEELVNKNIQAKGGTEKIKAIHSVRMSGKLTLDGGLTATFNQTNVRPNLVRETLALQGMVAVQAYDGASGWQIQPFQGRKDPELLGEDDLRDLVLDSDIDGPLVDYKEKGNTVEYLGHDVIDGDDALRLKVTLKNGDLIYYYLDPDTYLEIRKEIRQYIRGSVRDRVVDLGSYKPVAGVMYPFSTSVGTKANPGAQTYTAQKIEANVETTQADFALPTSLKQTPKPTAEKN